MEVCAPERELSEKSWDGNSSFDSSDEGWRSPEDTHKSFRDYFKVGVVIPAVQDRLDNLRLVLAYLADQTHPIEHVVIVCDGWQLDYNDIDLRLSPTIVSIEKHHPGMEQPRNVGVRFLLPSCTHVWFCDSDIILAEDALESLMDAVYHNPMGLVYAPYDWMAPGERLPRWDLHNDPRWEMFLKYEPHDVVRDRNFGVALGCFSGNLVWNIEEFKRVGGFWNELYMGRCEDGELGLRAAAMGIPMSMQRKARGWHVHHPINGKLINEKNSRDVPMINERHPWLQDEGIIVEDKDGKRFSVKCECGEVINTGEYWEHIENAHIEGEDYDPSIS